MSHFSSCDTPTRTLEVEAMTPLDVAALKAVAKELRSHIGKGGGRYLRYGNNVHPSLDTIADGALNEFADTIEASLPTNPVIEVTPEVKEAIEEAAIRMDCAAMDEEGHCGGPTHFSKVQRRDAAILRGLIREEEK